MAVYDAKLMREHLRKALFLPRLAGTALSAPPLDSMASSATRSPPRTHEISTRVALGAQLDAVHCLAFAGACGLRQPPSRSACPLPWLAAKFSSSFLYRVRPHDTATFVVVPLYSSPSSRYWRVGLRQGAQPQKTSKTPCDMSSRSRQILSGRWLLSLHILFLNFIC